MRVKGASATSGTHHRSDAEIKLTRKLETPKNEKCRRQRYHKTLPKIQEKGIKKALNLGNHLRAKTNVFSSLISLNLAHFSRFLHLVAVHIAQAVIMST